LQCDSYLSKINIILSLRKVGGFQKSWASTFSLWFRKVGGIKKNMKMVRGLKKHEI
jgi:hypothetical protein